MAGYDLSKILGTNSYNQLMSIYGMNQNTNPYVSEWSPSTPDSYSQYYSDTINNYTKQLNNLGETAQAPQIDNSSSLGSKALDEIGRVADVAFGIPFNLIAGALDNAQNNPHNDRATQASLNGDLLGDLSETAQGLGEEFWAGLKSAGNTLIAPFSDEANKAKFTPANYLDNMRNGKYGDWQKNAVEGVDEFAGDTIGNALTHTVMQGGDNKGIGKAAVDFVPYLLGGNKMGGLTGAGDSVSALVKNKSAQDFLGELTKADALKVASEGTPEFQAAYKLKALNRQNSDLEKLVNNALDENTINNYAKAYGVKPEEITSDLLKSKIDEQSNLLDEMFASDNAKNGEALWNKTNKMLGTYDGLENGVQFFGHDILSPETLQKLGSNKLSRAATIAGLSLIDPFAGIQGLGSAIKGSKLLNNSEIGNALLNTIDKKFNNPDIASAKMAIRHGGLEPNQILSAVDNITKAKVNRNFEMQLQDMDVKNARDFKKIALDNNVDLGKVTDMLETPYTIKRGATGNDKYELSDEFINRAKDFSQEELAQYRQRLADMDNIIMNNTGLDMTPSKILTTRLQANTYHDVLDAIEHVQKVKNYDLKSALKRSNVPSDIADVLDTKLASLNNMNESDIKAEVQRIMPEISEAKAKEYANSIVAYRDDANNYILNDRHMPQLAKLINATSFKPKAKLVDPADLLKNKDELLSKYGSEETWKEKSPKSFYQNKLDDLTNRNLKLMKDYKDTYDSHKIEEGVFTTPDNERIAPYVKTLYSKLDKDNLSAEDYRRIENDIDWLNERQQSHESMLQAYKEGIEDGGYDARNYVNGDKTSSGKDFLHGAMKRILNKEQNPFDRLANQTSTGADRIINKNTLHDANRADNLSDSLDKLANNVKAQDYRANISPEEALSNIKQIISEINSKLANKEKLTVEDIQNLAYNIDAIPRGQSDYVDKLEEALLNKNGIDIRRYAGEHINSLAKQGGIYELTQGESIQNAITKISKEFNNKNFVNNDEAMNSLFSLANSITQGHYFGFNGFESSSLRSFLERAKKEIGNAKDDRSVTTKEFIDKALNRLNDSKDSLDIGFREKYNGTQNVNEENVQNFITKADKFLKQIGIGNKGVVNGKNLQNIAKLLEDIPEGYSKEVDNLVATFRKNGFDLEVLNKDNIKFVNFSGKKTVNTIKNNIGKIESFLNKNPLKNLTDSSVLTEKGTLRDFLNRTKGAENIIKKSSLSGAEKSSILERLAKAKENVGERYTYNEGSPLRFPVDNYEKEINNKSVQAFKTLVPDSEHPEQDLTGIRDVEKQVNFANNPSDTASEAIPSEQYNSNIHNIIKNMTEQGSKFEDFKIPDVESGKEVNANEFIQGVGKKINTFLDGLNENVKAQINKEIAVALHYTDSSLNGVKNLLKLAGQDSEVNENTIGTMYAMVNPNAIILKSILPNEIKNNVYDFFKAIPKETLSEMPEQYQRLQNVLKAVDVRNETIKTIKNLEKYNSDMDEVAKKFADYAGINLDTIDKTLKPIEDAIREDRTHELSDSERYIYNAMKNNYDDMISKEGLNKFMDDYVPHLVSEEFKSNKKALMQYERAKNAIKARTNNFDKSRTLKGTIDEINAEMEHEHGYKNFLETDPIKLWAKRSIASNALMYERTERNFFIKSFGYRDYGESAFLDLSLKDIQKMAKDYGFKKADKLSVPFEVSEATKESGTPFDKLARQSKAKSMVLDKKYSVEKAEKQMYYEGYKEFINKKMDTGMFETRNGETYPDANYVITSINRGALQKILKEKGIENIGDKYAGNYLFDKNSPSDFIDIKELPKEIQDEIDLPTYTQLKQSGEIKTDLTPNKDYIDNHDVRQENTNEATESHSYIIHKDLAQRYDLMAKKQIDYDDNVLLKALSYVTRLFQAGAIMSVPFHERNALGNVANSWMEIGKEIVNPKKMKIATEIMLGKEGSFAGYNYKDIYNQAQMHGVLSTSFHTDNQSKIDTYANMTKDNMDRVMGHGDEVNPWKTLQNYNIFNPDKFFGYRINRKVGGAIEENAKLINFITHLEQGKSFREAGERTNKVLFDYTDLSDFEKNVMKRVIPFYSFMRKNVPLQMWALANRPVNAALTTKLLESFAKENESDQEKKLKPEYMSSQLPVGNHEYANVGLPITAMTDLLGKDGITGSVNPLIKLFKPDEQTQSKIDKAKTVADKAGIVASSIVPILKTLNDSKNAIGGDTKAQEALFRKAGKLTSENDIETEKGYALQKYMNQLKSQVQNIRNTDPQRYIDYQNENALQNVPKRLRDDVEMYLKKTKKSFYDLTPMEQIILGLK